MMTRIASRFSHLLMFALVTAVALSPATRKADGGDAHPADGLRYVPAGAAAFVHLDVSALTSGSAARGLRRGDPAAFDRLLDRLKRTTGVDPTRLRSATFFAPKLAAPGDAGRFAVVLAFKAPFDPAKEAAALKAAAPLTWEVASDGLLVGTAGLDAAPRLREPSAAGPLSAALSEAARGHVVTVGVDLAALPAALRGDDPPADVTPFRPLFRADTLVATLDWDADAALAIRVTAPTPAAAGDVAKALKKLLSLAADGASTEAKVVDRDAADDPDMKPLSAVLGAVRDAATAATVTADGRDARLAFTLKSDLAFAAAYTASTLRVFTGGSVAVVQNNLKQIALSMHNYASAHGDQLPMAAVCDKAGKPLLSWRVAVLPYLDEEALYKQFKLDEPWDSAGNKKLLGQMPRVFAVPGRTRPDDTDTHFRVFVGRGAAFEYAKGFKFAEITDGTSNTLMVVTAADAVPWTKPDEIAYDPDRDVRPELGYVAGGRCHVALGDGSVRAFDRRKPLTAETLHALVTKSGGEVVEFP